MPHTLEPPYALLTKERRGSRARCIILTDAEAADVAARLTGIVSPFARIDPDRAAWMPRGRWKPKEARLDQEPTFLSQELRLAVRAWWLAMPTKKANTPNWDIAAEAHIAGRQTLVLVEAKAHRNEFSTAGKPDNGNPHNHWKIAQAIEAASAELNTVMPGWRLSHDHCYQLANRFAWAWRLASLGMDVVLVYLGFLNCEEMRDCGPIFRDEDTWQRLVRTHARGCVPVDAWEQRLKVGAGSVTPLIRTDEIALAWSS